ncbi:MAG: SprT-like domain-containing protein [Sedimenticola sp.]|nr:SprT-like domain-containing protein [Sedimenticola sp.]
MFETAIQKEVEQQVQQLLITAGNHFAKDPGQVEIKFDLTGKAAGMAVFPHRARPIIRFNALLLNENQEDFLKRTVPHEVAHVIARCFFGKRIRPHGQEWKQVMGLFGAEASRCHSYDVSRSSRRTLKRFSYQCDCRTHELSSIRHNRVLQGQRYHCVNCKQPLKQTSKPL